jgi:hypothetical protein
MKGFAALAGFLAVTLFGCGDSCNEEDLTKSRGRSEAGGVADRTPRVEERLVLLFGSVGGKGGFGAEAFPRACLAESSLQGFGDTNEYATGGPPPTPEPDFLGNPMPVTRQARGIRGVSFWSPWAASKRSLQGREKIQRRPKAHRSGPPRASQGAQIL